MRLDGDPLFLSWQRSDLLKRTLVGEIRCRGDIESYPPYFANCAYQTMDKISNDVLSLYSIHR
jgi:hypothetical protein